MKNIFIITLLTSFLFSCNSTNVDNADWSGTTNQSDERSMIVDKLAKTPDWMKRNVRKNAIMITLRKAMESGNKRAVAIARKIAVSSDNSFFNRPKGK